MPFRRAVHACGGEKMRAPSLLQTALVVVWMLAVGQDVGVAKAASADEDDIRSALRKYSHAGVLGWLDHDDHHCLWVGIFCDITGHIKQLKLNNLGLEGGSVPKEWGILSKLVVLDLRDNDIGGELPEDWDRMESLEYLYLDNNTFSGSLPSSWRKMTKLRHLYLDNNNLKGELPEQYGEFENLEILYLENNSLSGPLPSEWRKLAKLTALMAGNNAFTGELPIDWSQMESLQSLHLGGNSLTGPVPISWSFLTELQTLYLHSNTLSGDLPHEFGWLQHLTVMSLDGNSFSGPLPESWGQLTALEFLYLQHNDLSGGLPTSWGALTGLRELHLDSNKLSGELPLGWATLRSLTHLYLQRNAISGSIPNSWVALAQLREIYLWSNKLSGPLPPSLGKLTNLVVVDLHDNELTGNLPFMWHTLGNLQFLYLYKNRLTSSLPWDWGNMKSLKQIMLQDNKLDGNLPGGWQLMSNVDAINLSNNPIEAVLTKDWFNLLMRLTWLGLSNTAASCVEAALVTEMSSQQMVAFMNLLARKTTVAAGGSIGICPLPPSPSAPSGGGDGSPLVLDPGSLISEAPSQPTPLPPSASLSVLPSSPQPDWYWYQLQEEAEVAEVAEQPQPEMVTVFGASGASSLVINTAVGIACGAVLLCLLCLSTALLCYISRRRAKERTVWRRADFAPSGFLNLLAIRASAPPPPAGEDPIHSSPHHQHSSKAHPDLPAEAGEVRLVLSTPSPAIGSLEEEEGGRHRAPPSPPPASRGHAALPESRSSQKQAKETGQDTTSDQEGVPSVWQRSVSTTKKALGRNGLSVWSRRSALSSSGSTSAASGGSDPSLSSLPASSPLTPFDPKAVADIEAKAAADLVAMARASTDTMREQREVGTSSRHPLAAMPEPSRRQPIIEAMPERVLQAPSRPPPPAPAQQQPSPAQINSVCVTLVRDSNRRWSDKEARGSAAAAGPDMIIASDGTRPHRQLRRPPPAPPNLG